MKSILLLRHSKASSNFEKWEDIDRPLTAGGAEKAYSLGEQLKALSLRIDLIASSSAVRTMHTASIVARSASLEIENIKVFNELYLPEDGGTLAFVKTLPDTLESVMIVGHNPDLSYLCQLLMGHKPIELPTCGLVAFTSSANTWSEIDCLNTRCDYTIFPTNHGK